MQKYKHIIFGLGMAAECAAYEFGLNNIDAFCVNKEFVNQSKMLGLPVLSYEDVCLNKFEKIKFFVATGYSNLNRSRAKIVSQLTIDGWQFFSIIPNSYYPLLNGIGINCFLMSGSNIQPFVKLKNNVFIWSGATICHHCELGNNIWITAGATIAGNTVIGDNVFIGVNATIVSGINIGSNVFIGAGALVTKDVPDNGVILAKGSDLMGIKSDLFIKFLENNGGY
jgi:sugar O-acyltransferase (sialic acid O-acetyltransferase NeuD family)